MNQIPEAWEPLPESEPPRIVCAAWRHKETGQLVVGVRHSCPIMRDNMDTHGGNSFWKGRAKSGFIDQYGKFYEREEAWKIAEKEGQIIRKVNTPPGTLYSEHLY